jgi:CRISP-associated protein Cas1
MIKRTLYFGNPAYLSKRDNQMLVRLPEVEKNEELPEIFKKEAQAQIPIEDIGVIVLDHQRIVLSHGLLAALLDNNVAVISCDDKHLPSGLFLPLSGNTLQSERFRTQIDASLPLKKNLWQQTITAKIRNQAMLLQSFGKPTDNMLYWAASVKSGDSDNHEGRAAAYYWSQLFDDFPNFRRGRELEAPNNVLNYGYAILRGIVARGLVATGLLPTLGIHHRNKYNAYCLADDIMEPYRPFVDKMVCELIPKIICSDGELTLDIKRELLKIPVLDVLINGERSPLMVGLQRTTASLYRCFEGEQKKIAYPEFPQIMSIKKSTKFSPAELEPTDS